MLISTRNLFRSWNITIMNKSESELCTWLLFHRFLFGIFPRFFIKLRYFSNRVFSGLNKSYRIFSIQLWLFLLFYFWNYNWNRLSYFLKHKILFPINFRKTITFGTKSWFRLTFNFFHRLNLAPSLKCHKLSISKHMGSNDIFNEQCYQHCSEPINSWLFIADLFDR